MSLPDSVAEALGVVVQAKADSVAAEKDLAEKTSAFKAAQVAMTDAEKVSVDSADKLKKSKQAAVDAINSAF